MPAWTDDEKRKLPTAVQTLTDGEKWVHVNKYHRSNVPLWKAVKIIMESNRDYRVIRHRYKNHHDVEMQENANRVLTQQEERTLRRYTSMSPGGSVKFIPGFTATATRMKIPVQCAKKRFVWGCFLFGFCMSISVSQLLN